MRTASFLFISAALHAAALGYPALLMTSAKLSPIAVTIVESADEGGGGGGGDKSPPAVKKRTAAPQPVKRARAADEAPAREAVALAAPTDAIALPVISHEANGAIEIPARVADAPIASQAAAPSSVASGGGPSIASAVNGGGGSGAGSGSGHGSGADVGSGSRMGSREGRGDGTTRFVQASYASCPKTDYPEAARREGWEGTVMVEVAVDEEGRPKSSRVYQSSGFTALDRAALDNIQRRCRFHPARHGATRVATSIKIPVVFRLADNATR
jgi:protein TonB